MPKVRRDEFVGVWRPCSRSDNAYKDWSICMQESGSLRAELITFNHSGLVGA